MDFFNNSEIINIKDTETGVAMFDKLSRIKDDRRVEPLDSLDNIPYPHRYLYDEYNLQIGDTYFMIPPEFIMVSSESTSQSLVTLRQENTQKMKPGYHKRTILIDLVFNGMEQLNGYPVDGPEGIYYVDGLRQLLAQFKCTPFLPITNELINGMYGVFTVALQSITISTIQGFPDAMTAQITLQEVNMFPYIEMPDVCFKYMIDWDLFRYYYQRLLTENHTYKKLQSLPSNKEHNKFKLSILDASVFDNESATKTNLLEIICDVKKVCKDADGNIRDSNYITWVDSDTSDVVISSFQCGYSNILTNIQLSDVSSPTVQFIGGMDTIYNITFETTDYSVVQAIDQCQVSNDLLTRNCVKYRSVGFVKLESELVEFTGSLFVMIESVTTNTVPGFPGLYNVQINCIAYDIAQSERESLHGFRPFDCSHEDCNSYEPSYVHSEQGIFQTISGLVTKVKQDNYAEWKLRTSIEVYPDLHLPTYSEVNSFIDKCMKFREKNKLSPLPYKKYPTNPACTVHGSHPDNKIQVNFPKYSVDIGSTSIEIPDFILPDSISDTVTYMDLVPQKGLEYDIYVDPDFYVFYPCSYKSFLSNEEMDATKEWIDDITQKAMGKYYDYDPKQRSSYTKSRTITNRPDYSGEGNVNDNLVEDFITLARTFIGHSYIAGAEGDFKDSKGECFDCSGFISYLLKKIGVMPSSQNKFTVSDIPNSDLFTEVPWSQMVRGDILCKADLSHVVIYQGNNSIIHASNPAPYPKGGVKEDDLSFDNGRCLRPKAFISDIASSNQNSDTVSYGEMYSSVEKILHQDLGVWPSITVDEMNAWIASKASKGSPFIGQGIVFINAARETGLDPRYILAHAALESGWGTSKIAQDKNNFFGIGAFDTSPYQSALVFGYTLEDGIVGGAKWIAKNYYHNEKWNQKTLYTMRWNNNVHQYATDPEWDKKIARLMVGAPNSFGNSYNNNVYILTKSEFESICRVVMAETQGEEPETEKAIAQVIYDRLTYSNRKFGGLSNILNSSGQFEAPYKGELNSTIENNVKAVFCNNDKYWPNYQALYFLTPDDTNVSFSDRNDSSDKLGEVGNHVFWGKKSKGSDIKYTITDKDGTSSTSSNVYEETQEVVHDAKTIGMENLRRFAEPVLIKSKNMMYDDTNLKGYDNTNASSMSMTQLNSGTNIFNTSFCDEYQYSARGRLVRAFPTYLFCILDDNAQWFDGRKLWTNYYIHRSVVDIAIHGTNDMPTETATITVTNSYHNLDRTKGGLTNYSLYEDSGYFKWIRDFYKFSGLLLGPVTLTDKIIKLHQIIYDHAKLREGARIHLRMGYGSDPLSLAPVMNGHISDISLGDQITAVITSDGHELIQHVTSAKEKDANNGFLGLFGLFQNQESSNIIANIMCERASWMHYLTAGYAFEGSKYSIEHFGLYFSQVLVYNEMQHISAYLNNIDDRIDTINEASNYLGFDIPVLSNIKEFVNSDTTKIILGTIGLIFGAPNSFLSHSGQSDLANDLFDGYQEQYDILKNIYKSNYHRSHYIYTSSLGNLDGERNVVFNKYNMTPWDIFQVCTQQVPEYIVKPSYHQFDSRLYFGLPFWMEKFRYDYLNGTLFEECKASTQVHMLDLTNIIDNQVKVTSKFSNTNVKVMYTRGSSGVSTKTVFSDDTIDFAYQKTSILDTPITQNALGPDALYELLGYKVGEESARRVGISNLLYGWQQQYQGEIILMGSSSIKPHDYVLIHDGFTNLYGVAIAREVTHSFNINTGFTTSITLGMIGFCTDDNSGMVDTCKNLLMVLNHFSSCVQARKVLLNNYEQNISIFSNFEILRNKMSCAAERSADIRNLMIGQTIISSTGTVIMGTHNAIKYGKAAFTLAKNFKNVAKAIKWVDTFKDGYKTIEVLSSGKTVTGVAGGIRNVYMAIKTGTTVAAGAPTSGIGSIILLVVWALVDIILTEVIEWFSNKNVCMLLPLWWEGYPFVSGVKDGEKILLCGSNANATEENTKGDSVENPFD